MGAVAPAFAGATEAGPASALRSPSGAQRHLLRRAQRLRLAALAARSAAVAALLLLLRLLAGERTLGAAQRGAAQRGAGKEREKKVPSAAIFDAQSVKVANHPGVRGYDAGKKIRGRKRHLVVDTLGLVLGVAVTAASVSDRAGALKVLPAVLQSQPRLEVLFADAGYAGGTLAEQLRGHATHPALRLEIVQRRDSTPKGFHVQPKRWVVERTFGWLMQARRLARDYETKPSSSAALILIQASRIMLRRLAR